jgi:hypothetical protein
MPGGRRPVPGASTRLRAEQPADVLAVLPYLLGYHPDESLVMAVVCERTIEVCVRIDLDAEPSAVAGRFADIADSNEASGVLLVAYSSDPECADRMLEPVVAVLDRTVGVIDALYADGRRWWSRMCTGDCCPAEGTAYEIDTSRLAAEAVYAGMSSLPDRSEIASQIAGPAPQRQLELEELAERIAVEVLSEPVPVRQLWIRRFVTEYVRRRARSQPVVLIDEDRLRLGCLAVDLMVRDEAWALMTRETAWIHVELWREVVSSAVSMLAPPSLCLLGMAAWIDGQGTLQVCCLERARQVDSHYSMADVLEDINDRALPPRMWDVLGPELSGALQKQSPVRAGETSIPAWSTPWSRAASEASRRTGRRARHRRRNRKRGDRERP